MPTDDIYGQVRRADFNRTEHETLSQLVSSAVKIGDEIKGDYVRLRQLTDDILKLLVERDLLRAKHFAPERLGTLSSRGASASDGSFQPVGGADGYWYVPISAALVIFPHGIQNTPQVKVGAYIQKIDERKNYNVGAVMEKSMLLAETTILKDWARDCPEGFVHFIDGPAIDPPHLMDKEYVKYRTQAILACLDKKIFVLCCAKRVLGNFLTDALEGSLREYEKERLSQFASDAHLVYHVFTKASMQSDKTLYTKPQEILDTNPIYKPYKNEGLVIYFMYFQRDPHSKPFRVDIPVQKGKAPNLERLGEQVAETISAWSYPGYDLPIPVVIADNKCNIRKGCADVLYSEIITRAASSDPFDNLVRTKLGTEVM